MMPLRNPFVGLAGYNCFGCAPGNASGLRMDFFEERDSVVSVWQPQEHFQGYANVLHGGIHATLMDELASWYVFVKLETSGVTQGLEVTFHRPVFADGGMIVLRAELEEMRKNRALIRTRLRQREGSESPQETGTERPEGISVADPNSEALCSYFTYPSHIARRRFHYPGVQAFRSTPDHDES